MKMHGGGPKKALQVLQISWLSPLSCEVITQICPFTHLFSVYIHRLSCIMIMNSSIFHTDIRSLEVILT